MCLLETCGKYVNFRGAGSLVTDKEAAGLGPISLRGDYAGVWSPR